MLCHFRFLFSIWQRVAFKITLIARFDHSSLDTMPQKPAAVPKEANRLRKRKVQEDSGSLPGKPHGEKTVTQWCWCLY